MRKNVRVTNALREVTSSRTSALAEKAVHLNPAGRNPAGKNPVARNCGGIKPREASFARANVVRCAGWMASAAG